MTKNEDDKPLVLKDELAKMARNADPLSWLRDAHAEIEVWLPTMPGIERLQLGVKFKGAHEMLELTASDGFGSTEGVAAYVVKNSTLTLRSNPKYQDAPQMAEPKLDNEQAFLAHLLGVLQFMTRLRGK